MRFAGTPDGGGVPAEQRFDVGDVLPNRHPVALPLVALVPLVMVMENEREDVVETVDEPVVGRPVDELVETAVEIGKVLVTALDVLQQREMLLAQRFNLPPQRRRLGQRGEGHR